MGTLDSNTAPVDPAGVDEKQLGENTIESSTSSESQPSIRNQPSTDSPDQDTVDKKEDVGEGNTEVDDDDNHQYPPKWRLVLITTAMCLSVFCMALVWILCS